jgi:hypothetical protein
MDIFKLLGLLIDFLESTMPRWVRLDSGELVGELTPAIDYQPSNRWTHAQRGEHTIEDHSFNGLLLFYLHRKKVKNIDRI